MRTGAKRNGYPTRGIGVGLPGLTTRRKISDNRFLRTAVLADNPEPSAQWWQSVPPQTGADIVVLNGGGTVITTVTRNATTTVAVNGGGAPVVTNAKTATTVTAVNGGGRPLVTWVHGHAELVTVHGGGLPAVTDLKRATGNVVLNGGGNVQVAKGARLFVTGGGTPAVTTTRRSSSAVTVNGGGTPAIQYLPVLHLVTVVVNGGGRPATTVRKDGQTVVSVPGGGLAVTVTLKHGQAASPLYPSPNVYPSALLLPGIATPMVHGGGTPTVGQIRAHVPLAAAVSGGGNVVVTRGETVVRSVAVTGGGEVTVQYRTLPFRLVGFIDFVYRAPSQVEVATTA